MLYRPLACLLEHGLFEPEQGEGQMWDQRNSKYAAAVGTQLLAKIHVLDNKLGHVDRQQNHPMDRLEEHLDFIRDTSDQVGKVVDKLNSRIDIQDVQIQQLANMVNDLVGTVEKQAKEIKSLKESREDHRKVVNQLTTKVIALEQYTEDIQKKIFPKVRRSRATWFLVSYH
jgi:methyl-accepting chemotaxis protein